MANGDDPLLASEFGGPWPQDPGGLTDFATSVVPQMPRPTFESEGYSVPGVGAAPGGQPSAFARFASELGAGLERDFTKTPLKAFGETLGLGVAGLGIANQLGVQSALGRQTRTLERGQQAAQAAAAPAVGFGQRQLASAEAGQLPPPMEAGIAQWVQQAKADMRARLASMGLGNSTDIQGFEAQIDQMALAMKAQLLQGQEGTALEALQTGVSAGTGVSQTAQQQQALLTNLIAAANQQLGRLSGSAA